MTASSPVRPVRQILLHNDDPAGYINRILVATPTRGTVRIEWSVAMRGLTVPANWSHVSMVQAMNTFIPVRFSVADAQNLIIREMLARDFEWLLLVEDDTIPPVDLLVKLNQYMRDDPVPVVSGLYYTKSNPSEPLIYRGRGNGSFVDFKMGERVWADGVATGCLLVHQALLRAMWEESEQYETGGQSTRRVFESPVRSWVNPETGEVNTITGTSDLDWCSRVMKDGFFKKSGWDKYDGMEFPFLVDTSIMCGHITPDGQVFPPR